MLEVDIQKKELRLILQGVPDEEVSKVLNERIELFKEQAEKQRIKMQYSDVLSELVGKVKGNDKMSLPTKSSEPIIPPRPNSNNRVKKSGPSL